MLLGLLADFLNFSSAKIRISSTMAPMYVIGNPGS